MIAILKEGGGTGKPDRNLRRVVSQNPMKQFYHLFKLILSIEFNHFTFHDLKRKGVTDTSGNKQEASGHRNASMLNIYDVKPSLVRPAGE